ncbi:MYND finger [Aphelenchoides besseyi]|nr:MYND finger [Aphelenchoides besseyi]
MNEPTNSLSLKTEPSHFNAQQSRDDLQSQTDWYMDDRVKRLLLDLQRHWLLDYRMSRERALVELTEKVLLHQESMADSQKIRTEVLAQFKDDLDNTRKELEALYQETLQKELTKMDDQHRRDLQTVKKKQWCWQCNNEAIYHCCWNTAYCSQSCQQLHWAQHRKNCRRRNTKKK